jgi:hypothetical protein
MTYTDSNRRAPASITFSQRQASIQYGVGGQGVFLFKTDVPVGECSFSIYDKTIQNGLRVTFRAESVHVVELVSHVPLVDEYNKSGLSDKKGAYYWFSLDSQNQALYAGLGEARLETIIYKYNFQADTHEEYETNKAFLESLTTIYLTEAGSASILPLKLLRDPVVGSMPLFVKHSSNLTMDDVAEGAVLPHASLAPIGRQLYECVAGTEFTLNTPDFPDFTEAIEYSIATPGCWCNTRLKEKATEFNKDKPDILETYLRITLGKNNGESPGIPYVMEIWPVGHYSPVHNHADAHAVIRVLHGSIHVKLFPFLCEGEDQLDPFGYEDFTKDTITWISPTHNQTHQLVNLDTNTDTCITIQCYTYDGKDKAHYDYFDYLDAENKKQQYEPDSDMDFVAFKRTVFSEWYSRPGQAYTCFSRCRR